MDGSEKNVSNNVDKFYEQLKHLLNRERREKNFSKSNWFTPENLNIRNPDFTKQLNRYKNDNRLLAFNIKLSDIISLIESLGKIVSSIPSEEDVYKCNICNDQCTNEEELGTHNIEHLKVSLTPLDLSDHECPLCNLYFFSPSACLKHIKLQCKLGPSKNIAPNHSLGSNNKISPKYPNKNKSDNKKELSFFKFNDSLDTSNSSTDCKYCGYRHNSHQALWTHMSNNHVVIDKKADNRFFCPICNTIFYRKTDLLCHITKTHLCCNFCFLRFTDIKPYSSHVIKCTKNEKQSVSCLFCGKKIKKTSEFIGHFNACINLHGKPKSYKNLESDTVDCKICRRILFIYELEFHLYCHIVNGDRYPIYQSIVKLQCDNSGTREIHTKKKRHIILDDNGEFAKQITRKKRKKLEDLYVIPYSYTNAQSCIKIEESNTESTSSNENSCNDVIISENFTKSSKMTKSVGNSNSRIDSTVNTFVTHLVPDNTKIDTNNGISNFTNVEIAPLESSVLDNSNINVDTCVKLETTESSDIHDLSTNVEMTNCTNDDTIGIESDNDLATYSTNGDLEMAKSSDVSKSNDFSECTNDNPTDSSSNSTLESNKFVKHPDVNKNTITAVISEVDLKSNELSESSENDVANTQEDTPQNGDLEMAKSSYVSKSNDFSECTNDNPTDSSSNSTLESNKFVKHTDVNKNTITAEISEVNLKSHELSESSENDVSNTQEDTPRNQNDILEHVIDTMNESREIVNIHELTTNHVEQPDDKNSGTKSECDIIEAIGEVFNSSELTTEYMEQVNGSSLESKSESRVTKEVENAEFNSRKLTTVQTDATDLKPESELPVTKDICVKINSSELSPDKDGEDKEQCEFFIIEEVSTESNSSHNSINENEVNTPVPSNTINKYKPQNTNQPKPLFKRRFEKVNTSALSNTADKYKLPNTINEPKSLFERRRSPILKNQFINNRYNYNSYKNSRFNNYNSYSLSGSYYNNERCTRKCTVCQIVYSGDAYCPSCSRTSRVQTRHSIHFDRPYTRQYNNYNNLTNSYCKQERIFDCFVCGKYCDSETSLMHHLKFHTM